VKRGKPQQYLPSAGGGNRGKRLSGGKYIDCSTPVFRIVIKGLGRKGSGKSKKIKGWENIDIIEGSFLQNARSPIRGPMVRRKGVLPGGTLF